MTPAPQELRQRLRDAGLRCTRHREALLMHLTERGGTATHAQLVGELGPEGWDRATIHRNLIAMAAAGLLRRVDMGDHVWRFEVHTACDCTAGHPRFLCDGCDAVLSLPGTILLKQIPGVAQVREVVLRGLCAPCASGA